MRVTEDKNGEPFGFCANHCGQQLRIGGNAARVEAFRKRYAWAGGKPAASVASPAPTPKPAQKAPAKPAPEASPAPAAKPASFSDLLANFGR
jgi:hypothetical protein